MSASTDRFDVSLHNPAMWRTVLLLTQLGAFVLLLLLLSRPIAGSRVPGLVTGLAIWVLANAVIVPLVISQLRTRLAIDLVHGTVTTRGRTHSAAEFLSATETARSFPGQAHLLTLVFRSGSIEVQTDGFTTTEHSRARDAALARFIWQWLPMPEQHRSVLSAGPMLITSLIGKREALALLS